jgi:pyruvate dehydrogenase E2 component (dihydrolipoamide acetyltransferase)
MAEIIELKVPDIGDFKDIPVIEVLVKPGDRVEKEASLLTLESDKATMEVPSPQAGTIKELKLKVGDKVSEGTLVGLLELSEEQPASSAPQEKSVEPVKAAQPTGGEMSEEPRPDAPAPTGGKVPETEIIKDPVAFANKVESDHAPIAPTPIDREAHRKAHASPAVRLFARELGVDLSRLSGSGPKGRILKEDVQRFVKGALQGSGGAGIPPIPAQDFSKFGEIETRPLPRIKKISGPHLLRAWLNIPHITQFDAADITELEAFRVAQKDLAEKRGVKLTLLAFLVKACAAALRELPDFNSSLAPEGDALIIKKYINIGVAVDTPEGLVVPVIKDADKKGVFEIAADLAELSKKARDKKLAPADMQGGTFSISSLGGIGGTAFTPIVNAPEVAILGVSRSEIKPVWNGKEFAPRLMLPLSLSYDHRVIDGAAGARFTTYLAGVLGDIRRLLL